MLVQKPLLPVIGLVIVVTGLFFAAKQASAATLRDDATGGDCTQIGVWNSDTKTCTLTGDVSEEISMVPYNSSGITLDGGGYAVRGPGNSWRGIFIQGVERITLRNLRVEGWTEGISLVSTSHIIIDSVTISHNTTGIWTNGVPIGQRQTNSRILNSVIEQNDEGIYFLNSGGYTLENNMFSGNNYHLRFTGAIDEDFDNSIDTSNTVDGKPIYYLQDIQNQTFDSSTNAGFFFCQNCNGIAVKDLTITHELTGIYLRNTSNSRIEGVNVSQSEIALMLEDSSDNVITGSALLGNGTGVLLTDYSERNRLEQNQITGTTGSGIVLGRNGNFIIGNTITDSRQGVIVVVGENHVITENTFSNNEIHIVIDIPSYLPFPLNPNSIYRNNFLSFRGASAIATGFQYFSLPPPIGGNYWQNYDTPQEGCVDNNSDNFCDNTYNPHPLFSVRDYYPWKVRDGWKAVEQKTPVLIIPGILGSELYNGDDLIWADLTEMLLPGDYFLTNNLSLDGQGNSILNISVGDIIDELPTKDIFRSLINDLVSSGYVQDIDIFLFPYDWRLDLETMKAILSQKIESIKIQTGSSQVDIIAHSMGGLLTKDYINEFGKDSVRKLIFIGTPHLGAPKAAKVLLSGDNFSIPWLEPERMKEFGRNSISAYELLPHQKYFDTLGGYIVRYKLLLPRQPLNYPDTKEFLLNRDLNAYTFSKAENFFSKNLQDYDFTGIDTYNIAGCKLGTQSKYHYVLNNSTIGLVELLNGDETVPLGSAEFISIPSSQKYYAKGAKHSELPSTNGVRQLITQILTDQPLTPTDNVSNDSSFCSFRGKLVIFRSPVEVHIYDSQGRHTGPIENNAIEYGIPGVNYDVIDGEKFIFLPTDSGEQYTIIGRGTAQDTFDLLISDNDNGQIISTQVFNDVPVTDTSTVQFDISESTPDNTIQLDYDGSGNFQTLPVSVELPPEQTFDLVPPETNAAVTGTDGKNGWYTSSVNVEMTVFDDTSGVFETKYALDGGVFTSYSNPITISTEGIHTLSYYSVDRAGNNEEVKVFDMKIDTTAPEVTVEFNASAKDFQFASVDTIDQQPSITCTRADCVLEDQAGNMTEVKFRKKRDSPKYFLTFFSISYNGVMSPFPKNAFVVEYKEKKGRVIDFDQSVFIKNEQMVRIDYEKKVDKSIIVSLSPGGTKSKQIVPGIRLLQERTNKGNLQVSY